MMEQQQQQQRSVNVAPGNQFLFDSVILATEDGQFSTEHFKFEHSVTLLVRFVLRDFAAAQSDVEIGGRVEVQCNKRFSLAASLTEWVFALTRRIQPSDHIVWLDLIFFCNFLSSSSSTLLVLYDLHVAQCPSILIPQGLKLLRSNTGGAGIALMPLADVPNELNLTAKLRFSCFNDKLTCSQLLGPLSAIHWEDVIRPTHVTVRRCRLCVRWALRGWKKFFAIQATKQSALFSPHFGAEQVALVFQLCLHGLQTYPKDHLVLQLRVLHLPEMCRSRGLRLAANIALQGATEQKIVHRHEKENGALVCSFGPQANFAQHDDLRLQALVEFELSKDQYTECAILLEPFSDHVNSNSTV